MQFVNPFSAIYISSDINLFLAKILDNIKPSKLFVLVDENTKIHCLPILKKGNLINDAEIIEISSGELNKSVQSVQKAWEILSKNGADRNSLLINLGGGIIVDLGGFIASTFKRGIPFINIPTTLLSQVDASVGGKTGFNFLQLKNEIGTFSHPDAVIINSIFLKSLDKDAIYSGWAEMIKHALIYSKADWENIKSHRIEGLDYESLNKLIARSIQIKVHFVEQDPLEKGIRKALNFGHTFGHAFESLFMGTPNEISHGKAVAHGMICELYLSHKKCGFSEKEINKVVEYLGRLFGKLPISSADDEQLLQLIKHDKKNKNSLINFTLLSNFGNVLINISCTDNEILDALNWYKKTLAT
ncbi:MAG: 3-dehydroquinate synthase [Bacteroidales bacterium]